jgi:hypothetical protein
MTYDSTTVEAARTRTFGETLIRGGAPRHSWKDEESTPIPLDAWRAALRRLAHSVQDGPGRLRGFCRKGPY